jgi:hypothetical protein
MYTHPAQELDGGGWAERNPSTCPCRNGWLASDWDTWHRCPIHGKGVPHPEDEDATYDYAALARRIHREAFVWFRGQALRSGMTQGAFRTAVRRAVRSSTDAEPTMADWVDAADKVAEEVWREAAEARAQAAGYSCRLEAALEAEAAFEHGCRRRGLDPDMEEHGPLAVDRDSWYRR